MSTSTFVGEIKVSPQQQVQGQIRLPPQLALEVISPLELASGTVVVVTSVVGVAGTASCCSALLQAKYRHAKNIATMATEKIFFITEKMLPFRLPGRAVLGGCSPVLAPGKWFSKSCFIGHGSSAASRMPLPACGLAVRVVPCGAWGGSAFVNGMVGREARCMALFKACFALLPTAPALPLFLECP